MEQMQSEAAKDEQIRELLADLEAAQATIAEYKAALLRANAELEKGDVMREALQAFMSLPLANALILARATPPQDAEN